MNKVIDKGFRSCRFVSTIVKHPVYLKSRGGSRVGDFPPKTYQSNFFHYEFVQFRKKVFGVGYKAILPSIVLSQ